MNSGVSLPFISIAMYPAIHRYDDQAFDYISEESEKKNFIVKKSLWHIPSQGIVEQTQQNGNF